MDFTYPIIPNDHLPRSNPYAMTAVIPWDWVSYIPWNWLYTKWDEPITRNINYIKEQFPDGYIPIGTRLYHGSLEQLDFKALKRDRITFFGLDVVISIWYILELADDEDTIGKLYEFTVIQPIPLRILYKLYNHPSANPYCRKDKIACIHPTLAFHGQVDTSYPPYDLSIEITMNMKYFKDYIQVIKTYDVDTRILYKNRRKLFSEFNPTQAITKVYPDNTNAGGRHKSYKYNRHKSAYTKTKKRIV